MPPSLNEDAPTLPEHDLLELQANTVIELAAADDLASGLAPFRRRPKGRTMVARRRWDADAARRLRTRPWPA